MKKRKVFTKDHLKKARKLTLSKSFLGAFLFAAALWAFNTMNDIYVVNYSIPLTIETSENRSIHGNVPEKIRLKVRGQGWNLFYLMNFNTSARCVIDLTDIDKKEDYYRVSRREIISGVQEMINVETIDVVDELLSLNIGTKIEKSIPVKPRVDFSPREYFMLAGDFSTEPDSIVIKGDRSLLDTIDFWLTEKVSVSDAYKPVEKNVKLKDPETGIEISQNEVLLKADIQQIAEKQIYDIPVKVKGGRLPKNMSILPVKINIFLRGGAEDMAAYDYLDLLGEISAALDYSAVMKDSTGSLMPEIKVPPEFKVIKTEPIAVSPVRYFSGKR